MSEGLGDCIDWGCKCRLCTVRLDPEEAVVDAVVLVDVLIGGSKTLELDEVGTNWDTARASSSAKWSAKLAVFGSVDVEGSREGRED